MWRKSVKQDTYNANAAALKRCLDLSALVILSKVSRMYKSKSFGATSGQFVFSCPHNPMSWTNPFTILEPMLQAHPWKKSKQKKQYLN